MILVRRALGEVLRQHRNEQGRTLRDVADAARVSLGYLSEIERGQKEPSSELLFAVSDALNVPLSDVLAQTGDHLRVSEDEQSRTPSSARAVPGGVPRPPSRATAGSGPTRPGPPPARAEAAALDSATPARAAVGRVLTARNAAGSRPLTTTRVVLGRPAAVPEQASLGDLVTMPQAATETLHLESLAIVVDGVVSSAAVPAVVTHHEGRELADAIA